ncbi:Aspartyl protease [Myroides marinus]|uniref:Aspartyl protease n=1 Tax=Myroides marinus TaxID=703342 RepID=A0A1H6X3U7_9FLAO|nr:retropepsin-like aspartic protease [Myroides marinus]SEJ19710.1 Aspartyl protease [Myroides marinus]
MKKSLLFLSTLVSTSLVAQVKLNTELNTLAQNHQYTQLFEKNKTNKATDKYYFDALYYSCLNQPKQSNDLLKQLAVKDKEFLKNVEYWKLVNENSVRTFDFNQAYKASKYLVDNFKNELTDTEYEDEQNNLRIWNAIKSKPVQRIQPFTSIILPVQKDFANLTNVDVTANNITTNFVFDTGAGLNCITASLAKQMGFQIIESETIKAKSFTGANNEIKIAIAPKLTLGELIVENTIFLVFPDNAFTFAEGLYIINGIIGFPVAKELGTITFETDKLTFSKNIPSTKEPKNLFFESLRPIVMLEYRGKNLPFNLDTGAQNSMFSKPLFDLFSKDITAKATKTTNTTSSAGAQQKTIELYQLENQTFKLNNQSLNLPKMLIDSENVDVYGAYNYGNIGQDILSQYKKVIISFEHNYLKLEQ